MGARNVRDLQERTGWLRNGFLVKVVWKIFLGELRRGRPVSTALEAPAVFEYARQFVRQTFDIIEGENLCAIASAFTFGREDLLPAVFQRNRG